MEPGYRKKNIFFPKSGCWILQPDFVKINAIEIILVILLGGNLA